MSKILPHFFTGLMFVFFASMIGSAEAVPNSSPKKTLLGVVEGNGAPQAGYKVYLFASDVAGKRTTRLLGTDTTDGLGLFEINYKLLPGGPPHLRPVLYILAERDESMLASAIGKVTKTDGVVVNERTTIAIGFAFAQFIDGRNISGNTYGMLNAVHMAANLANPKTGAVGDVLGNYPNGTTSSTLSNFNALTNIVANCIFQVSGCDDLFLYATPDGGSPPVYVLQAISNIARDPSWNALELYALSKETVLNTPVPDVPPDAWTLVLRFGDTDSQKGPDNVMNGPGNFAIDEHGILWVNNNYVPELPNRPACASQRLLKFHPWGEQFADSPYFGGGLSGAGYGIGLDPHGRVWVGNFGFEASECANTSIPPFPDTANKIPAQHNSASKFRADGFPISPDPDGFFIDDTAWPQATISDKQGNIWTANCGTDSVTFIRRGNPSRARTIFLKPTPGSEPVVKPFGMATDLDGNAWVTGNKSETLWVISPNGSFEQLPGTNNENQQVIYKPMAVAADSKGNMWIANSDTVDVPCPPPVASTNIGPNTSVSLYMTDNRKPHKAAPFGLNGGGGITIPWGISVDGDDNVWVANFGVTPLEDPEQPTILPRVSHFCGTDTTKCPARAREIGAAISPDNGYTSDALQRNTTTAVDLSGNLWLTNNWRLVPPRINPGGNSIVVYVGIAKPIKTPLIGPPISFD